MRGQGRVETRPTGVGTIPVLTKGQREDIATIAVRAAYGMAWEEDDDE